MLLGNQHPPLPWQPPHPSWDVAHPDDEVISRGERGRQAGRGTCQGLAGTQTCHRHVLRPEKPGPPVLAPPTFPAPEQAGGSADRRSAGGARAVLAGAPKSPRCQAEPSSPELAASRWRLCLGIGIGGGPMGRVPKNCGYH